MHIYDKDGSLAKAERLRARTELVRICLLTTTFLVLGIAALWAAL